MIGARIDYAQRISRLLQIKSDPAYIRLHRAAEVDRYNTADCACQLIHQAAGLAKIHIFRILAAQRQIDRLQLVTAEQMVEDHAN